MKFRMGMTALITLSACLYFPLNHSLTGGYNLSTPWDAWILLWPVWVIPYLLCLPVWMGGLIWAAWKMEGGLFRAFVISVVFVLSSSALFYYVFPTYVHRPVLVGNGWTTKLLEVVNRNDGTYNAFPSGHVFQTSLFCLFFNRLYPNHLWFLSGILLIVILSTLFTHQHYLVDPLGGLGFAWLGYRFGMYMVPQKT